MNDYNQVQVQTQPNSTKNGFEKSYRGEMDDLLVITFTNYYYYNYIIHIIHIILYREN